jgi:nucleoside-diphosphate-sugar epimerase
MKILLTGHKGYIGSVAASMVKAAGHEVVGLDSDLFAGCDFGPVPSPIPEIHKDLRNVIKTDLVGFDAVLHFAALSNDPLGDIDPALTYDINHIASIRLAKAAKSAGVKKFVFSSSCSTYGAAGDDLHDEAASLNPVTPYGESKVLAERDLGKLADDHFSPVCMRNATAYGVSPRLRLDIVLNDLVAGAFLTGKIQVKSDGSPWRPITHIRDIIAAALAAAEAPRSTVHNEVFNVGRTDENYRISELAEIVAETVPGSKIEYAPGGGPDKRCYRVSCEKIKRMLPSFRPQWTARKGAKELYDAYVSVGLTNDDILGGRFVRIKQIQRLLQNRELDPTLRAGLPHCGKIFP